MFILCSNQLFLYSFKINYYICIFIYIIYNLQCKYNYNTNSSILITHFQEFGKSELSTSEITVRNFSILILLSKPTKCVKMFIHQRNIQYRMRTADAAGVSSVHANTQLRRWGWGGWERFVYQQSWVPLFEGFVSKL